MKRKRFLIVAAIALLVVGVAMGLWLYRIHTDVDHIVQNLYQLPTTTTAKALERKGFINLTEVQPGRIPEIAAFGAGGQVSNKNILKTFRETEDDLVVTVFVRSKGGAVIRMVSNYHVKGQYEDGPGRTYRWITEEVEREDGVTEVWLRGHNPDANQPDPEDCLLYSYQR